MAVFQQSAGGGDRGAVIPIRVGEQAGMSKKPVEDRAERTKAGARSKFRRTSADIPAMKALLPIGIYLCLVFVLGLVMAMTAPREGCEREAGDDEF